MFRPEIKAVVSLLAVLLFFSSCGTSQILGLYRQDAAEPLHKGDLDFIIRAELPEDFSAAVSLFADLSDIHPAAAYYAGILVGARGGPPEQIRNLQWLLFSAALESPSPPARREATNRLVRMILETGEDQELHDILGFLSSGSMNQRADARLLRSAALYRLGRFDEAARLLPTNPEAGWEQALSFFTAWRTSAGGVIEAQRREIAEFLFGLPAGYLRRWAYTEALAIEGLLTPGERGVIFSRRFPVSHRVTVNNLRPALEDGGLLFFHNPALIGDIARAYQFTPALREEGLELFRAWDSLLESFTMTMPSSILVTEGPEDFRALEAFVRTLDREALNARRYLILHHSGRIERARGRFAESAELFRRALAIAPDALQSDACIWYILMNTLAYNPSGAAAVFLETMPYWNTMATFNAVIDRLSRQLAAERQWDTLLEVFDALQASAASGIRPAASRAQFAWIVGRAVQEGFLTTNRSAESFFRIAFEEPNGTFYYRTMAALQLGENFSPLGNTRRRAAAARVREGGELEFILGFFDYGAASFVMPYIRAREGDLSIPELRKVATTLAATNLQESMRLVARYMRRDDFTLSREDLYLSHPRPYVEIVERYAREMGLAPEMMFGLIRTESFFAADVVSHAGAVGLAQLMPATAQDIAGRVARAGGTDHRSPNGINLTDPQVNVHLGSFYMRHLIHNQMGGSTMLALMAYNGGQGRVRRWLAADRQRDGGLPKDLFLETILYPETRNYGRLVLSAAAIYGYLYYGITMEEVARRIFYN